MLSYSRWHSALVTCSAWRGTRHHDPHHHCPWHSLVLQGENEAWVSTQHHFDKCTLCLMSDESHRKPINYPKVIDWLDTHVAFRGDMCIRLNKFGLSPFKHQLGIVYYDWYILLSGERWASYKASHGPLWRLRDTGATCVSG